jgi:hypothetical protein
MAVVRSIIVVQWCAYLVWCAPLSSNFANTTRMGISKSKKLGCTVPQKVLQR